MVHYRLTNGRLSISGWDVSIAANGGQTDPPLPGRVLERNADPVLGHRPAWLPYPDYGSMQPHDATGNKAPDRPHRSTHGPQPTAGSSIGFGTDFRSFGKPTKHDSILTRACQSRNPTLFGTIGNRIPTTKRERDRGYNQPTDGSRARHQVQPTARAVRPRSHNSETMTELARYHGKSTGYCNYSDMHEVGR